MIYLDHHATTPVDPQVLATMLPYFGEHFGNPASRNHAYGWAAEQAVETARAQVAALLNANAKEIVFTAGATEANNLALLGVTDLYEGKGRHVVTTAIEHKAILDVLPEIERRGGTISLVEVDGTGRVDPARVAALIRPETVLVSVMHANNEVGTIQDVAAIGALCKARGVVFHVDAAQTVGQIPVDVQAMGIDLLSLSGHKCYGPKGVGALYVRRRSPRVRLHPQSYGGGQERGMRSGTLNVPGIVGLGAACELAGAVMADEAVRLAALRDRLLAGLRQLVPDLVLNGHPTARLPHNLHVSFRDVAGETLMMSLRGVAVSSGSACTSASLEPSHVLKAMGVPNELAHGSLRFGLGRGTTAAAIDETIRLVGEQVRRLQATEAR